MGSVMRLMGHREFTAAQCPLMGRREFTAAQCPETQTEQRSSNTNRGGSHTSDRCNELKGQPQPMKSRGSPYIKWCV